MFGGKIAFKLGGMSYAMVTYVDNLFALAHSPDACAKILEDAKSFLVKNWRLQVKLSIRCIMPARGCGEVSWYQYADWYPLVAGFETLAHTLDDEGSIRSCWKHTAKKM